MFSINTTTISNKNPNAYNSECNYSLNKETPHELDWNIIEIEEDVKIGFDTKKYLPKNFNPFKGMDNIDWSSIELIEIEEEVELSFNTKDYLPDNFCPYKGMA